MVLSSIFSPSSVFMTSPSNNFILQKHASGSYGLVGLKSTGSYWCSLSYSWLGRTSLIILSNGFSNICRLRSNPHFKTNVLYWVTVCNNPLPDSNMVLIKSLPVLSFLIETKKSIVLYLDGFHLKERSQVVLVILPATPTLSLPTPQFEGVKMSPSVLYSYNPWSILYNILAHRSNIEIFFVVS